MERIWTVVVLGVEVRVVERMKMHCLALSSQRSEFAVDSTFEFQEK